MPLLAHSKHPIAAGFLSATAPAAPGYEEAPTLRASEVLPPELARGPHHRIAEDVRNDGFWNDYRIESNFGRFWAHGAFQLRVRLRELTGRGWILRVEVLEAAAPGEEGRDQE